MARIYLCMNCQNDLSKGSNFCDRCGTSTTFSLWSIVQEFEDQVKKLRLRRKKVAQYSIQHSEKIPPDKFSDLYKKGLNDREIAKELNVNPSTIYRLRKKMGLSANAPRGFPDYINEMKKKQSEEKPE